MYTHVIVHVNYLRVFFLSSNISVIVLLSQVGARLISHAGSLTNLAKYPASTVQILGAEKALFRYVHVCMFCGSIAFIILVVLNLLLCHLRFVRQAKTLSTNVQTSNKNDMKAFDKLS